MPPTPFPLSVAPCTLCAYRRRLHIKNLYRLLRFVFELLLFRLSRVFLVFSFFFWLVYDLENVALGA